MSDIRPWRINPLPLLGLVFVLLQGCGKTGNGDALSRAQQFAAERRYDAAIVELKSLLQEVPNNGEARLLLGSTYLEVEDYASAEKELQRARLLGVTESVYAPLLARALFFQNQPNEVLELEIAGTPPVGPEADLNATRALAYLALDQEEKAKTFIERALRAVPDSNWVRYAHARTLIAGNSQATAISLLEKLLQDDPNNGIAWSLLGDIYTTFGKLAEAENAYTQAINNRRKKSTDYLRRGFTRLKQRKFDAAAGDAEILLRLYPKWIEAWYFAGEVKFRQNRLSEAEKILEDAHFLDLEHFQVAFLLARTYLALDKMERAESLAESAYHLKPQLPVTRNLLVEIYLRQNKGEKAEELLRPVLAAYPENLSTRMALASSLTQQNKYAEAEALFLNALQSAPSSVEARAALAYFYLETDKPENAVDLLQDWSTKHDALSFLLAEAYVRARQYDRAKAVLEQVVERSPDSAKAHYGLARVNMILGNLVDAQRQFREAAELDEKK